MELYGSASNIITFMAQYGPIIEGSAFKVGYIIYNL
jgi:hypothetical protein